MTIDLTYLLFVFVTWGMISLVCGSAGIGAGCMLVFLAVETAVERKSV